MAAKFEFFEVVLISTDRPEVREVNSERGAILGRSQGQKKRWNYAVHVFKLDEVWDLRESELSSTGQFMKREDFYDGDTQRIVVDQRTGEGKLVDK